MSSPASLLENDASIADVQASTNDASFHKGDNDSTFDQVHPVHVNMVDYDKTFGSRLLLQCYIQ